MKLSFIERPPGVPFQKIQFGNERGGRSVLSRLPELRIARILGVVSRSAKWGGSYLGGSSWNRPQRPNPGHLRDCWGCLGRFLGRLGHRTTAIVSTRGVGKSLEFRPGAPRGIFLRLTETPVNKSKLCWYLSEVIHTVVWRIYFSETRFHFSDIPTSNLPHFSPW